MRLLVLATILLTLTACTPEKFGAWVRTQSGTIVGASQQAKDALTLTKMQLEAAKKQADEISSRAKQVQQGVTKIVEGQELVKQGLEGGGQSSSSSK